MKTINPQATRIFCRLLDQMGTETQLTFNTNNHPPLLMQQKGGLIATQFGKAQLYSLGHYPTCKGITACEPEMRFIVLDKRVLEKDYGAAKIFPQAYRDDTQGLDEESIVIEDSEITSYKPLWQQGHIQFANEWLAEIRKQGYGTTVKTKLKSTL